MECPYGSQTGAFADHRQENGVELNPQFMAMGFARRAALYKRPEFIFHRMDIMEPLLNSGRVQMVFSGKSHPKDESGKLVLSKIVEMSRRFPRSVVF